MEVEKGLHRGGFEPTRYILSNTTATRPIPRAHLGTTTSVRLCPPPSRQSGACPPSPPASARSRCSVAETEACREGERTSRSKCRCQKTSNYPKPRRPRCRCGGCSAHSHGPFPRPFGGGS